VDYTTNTREWLEHVNSKAKIPGKNVYLASSCFLKCLKETFSLLPRSLYRLFGVSLPKPEEKQPGRELYRHPSDSVRAQERKR
jgi:hypothetical protein